jgi:acetyl/propionyl-CoA carboxylase alpha subunit
VPINRALREYRLEGIETIIFLHARLLEEDAFHSGETTLTIWKNC